jgi:hypothetical protein
MLKDYGHYVLLIFITDDPKGRKIKQYNYKKINNSKNFRSYRSAVRWKIKFEFIFLSIELVKKDNKAMHGLA